MPFAFRLVQSIAVAVIATVTATTGAAQQQTTGEKVDTVVAPVTVGALALQRATLPRPPLSPGKAFLTSFAIPGLAQARFDRGSAGALFAAVEISALAMIKRSNDEVQTARRFRNDSLPNDFQVMADGSLRPTGVSSGGFDDVLVRRRRLHMEDWLALILFNHLIAGADAFVSSQLWDLPAAISAYPASGGGAVAAVTIRW